MLVNYLIRALSLGSGSTAAVRSVTCPYYCTVPSLHCFLAVFPLSLFWRLMSILPPLVQLSTISWQFVGCCCCCCCCCYCYCHYCCCPSRSSLKGKKRDAQSLIKMERRMEELHQLPVNVCVCVCVCVCMRANWRKWGDYKAEDEMLLLERHSYWQPFLSRLFAFCAQFHFDFPSPHFLSSLLMMFEVTTSDVERKI